MAVSQRKAGAILSYIGLAVNAAVSFVYVPLLLGFLTTEEYGVYELIGSIIAYLSVMDMGLSTTLNRFYAREKAVGSQHGVENLLAMAAIIYGFLTAIAVAVGFGCDALLDALFGDSFTPGELDLAHQMMMLVILNCAVVLPGNWFLALINANERFVFARSLSIVKYVLQVVVVLAVLNWRSSAVLVLAVQVMLNVAAVAAYALYVKGKLRIRAKLHRWDGGLLRDLFVFSFFILLNIVYNQVLWKTGQVVLGIVAGAAPVAVYGVVCKLITAGYMQVSTGVTSVFLPKLTAISAKTEDMTEINELFCRIGHIQAILVWGVCGAFAALGAQFVLLWAGPDFVEAYPATLVLMLFTSIPLVQNLGISVLQAKNKLAFRALVYIGIAVAVLALSFPAAGHFGVMGCAWVTALVTCVGTGPIMNIYYKRVIGIDVGAFFKTVLPVVAPIGVASLATWWFCSVAPAQNTWAGFLLGVVFFVAVYAVTLSVPGPFGFNSYERALVRGILRRMHLAA